LGSPALCGAPEVSVVTYTSTRLSVSSMGLRLLPHPRFGYGDRRHA
jgi:hypothetical protein